MTNMKLYFLILGAALATSQFSQAATGGKLATGKLVRMGTVSISAGPPAFNANLEGLEYRNNPEQDREFDRQIGGAISPARVPAAHVPQPPGSSISGLGSLLLGVNGISHAEQRLAGSGVFANSQFSSEPPDQGLAIGNGFIVEAVNSAIRVRNATTGAPITFVVPMNQFFNQAPSIIRSNPPVYGAFLADPKCYYDSATGRFFVTILWLGVNAATGAFDGTSKVLIAVSASNVPAVFQIYSLDTVNGNGSVPSHPNCPCFGDQPLIGADLNGFYVSTNEFPIFSAGFNGAQLYAISKADLVSGVPAPRVVVFDGLPLAEGPAYTLQPATVPPGGAFAPGREYFLSALDFPGTLDNRIALWELSGTASLNSATPNLILTSKILESQVYGQPPAAEQRDGPLPLADFIFTGAITGRKTRELLPLVESNDDRMQQTVYAAGKLWAGLNTVVKPDNGPVRAGIAYFVVEPTGTGATLNGTIVKQGYVSVNRNNVIFPSIGVNNGGKGVMTFTLVGQDFFPSAAYVPIDATSGAGAIRISALGVAPEDGFTGYAIFGGRAARWGDYSAAVADESGNIWTAVEYIPNLPRTLLANWGTFISKVNPLNP